jgi:hypothetical protein
MAGRYRERERQPSRPRRICRKVNLPVTIVGHLLRWLILIAV